uniref:C2 domain-containing protein SRC2 n=1 Tax=Beta vulgaris subsp. vulgaris TaxID=3555 RepID=J3S669_BETVV|nr:C2 domain-containing protein SRC2 [Beta vulgaris subsp. vulgaris]
MTEPFQLLHINIISARDLAPVSKSMNTYVVGWVNPYRKLTTRVDHKGNNCPEWNDKFVFRVTPKFLNSDSSIVDIEIYSQAWLRDALIGSVRVSIANLIPTGYQNGSTRRSVALQIRRPSGRPQGILNVVVSVLDGTTIDQEPRAPRPAGRGPEPGPSSSMGGSMCNSDVGPSASVVAAAVAKGLYMPTVAARGRGRGGGKGNNDDDGSSILQWEDEESEEGIMTKIERWKMEMQKTSHGGHGHGRGGGNGGRRGDHVVGEGVRHKHNKHRRAKTEGGRLFRCFGKAYGFEFTIVCGANHGNDRNNKNAKKKVHHTTISDDDTNSQSYIII